MRRLNLVHLGDELAPLGRLRAPTPGTLHRFQLHGRELFAEESWSALYTTGGDSQAARSCLAAGFAAAKDPEASAVLLVFRAARMGLLLAVVPGLLVLTVWLCFTGTPSP